MSILDASGHSHYGQHPSCAELDGWPKRLRNKIQVTDIGCWQWMGYLSTNGYAVTSFGHGRRDVYIHRWAYETFIEPIRPGMQIDHLCRNRACVNPSHLEQVTQAENILRGESPWAKKARQTHCIHGHELSGINVYYRKDGRGKRNCRACDRLRRQQRRLQNAV